jgi:hypothetical protein
MGVLLLQHEVHVEDIKRELQAEMLTPILAQSGAQLHAGRQLLELAASSMPSYPFFLDISDANGSRSHSPSWCRANKNGGLADLALDRRSVPSNIAHC